MIASGMSVKEFLERLVGDPEIRRTIFESQRCGSGLEQGVQRADEITGAPGANVPRLGDRSRRGVWGVIWKSARPHMVLQDGGTVGSRPCGKA